MHMNEPKLMVGGQAVLEGVMMRSPETVAVAVRKPDGNIVLKKEAFTSWTKRYPLLGWPFIRGGVILIESMVMGIKALNFSSSVAMQNEKKEPETGEKAPVPEMNPRKNNNLTIAFTMIIAFTLGLALFFYLPLILTGLTGVKTGLAFNLIDGVIRLIFFLTYLFLISLWKDIRRVFEYHGAEHKSIFAYENKQPLTLENVKPYTTHHPRCGTSFLLIVMLVSILVFIPLGKPDSVHERLVRLLFIPLIGGISYEGIRLSGSRFGLNIARLLVFPGLWLQRITTREPDDRQLEVALVALKAALNQHIEPEIEFHSP